MNVIKFSKEYNKLHGQKKAVLLAVARIKIDRSGKWDKLLEYDTTATDGTRYEIKPGNYIQLVFCGEEGIPFCTIRSDRPALNGMKSKFDFYNEKVGEEFEIVRTWENENGQV